jgi:hypothetical protein
MKVVAGARVIADGQHKARSLGCEDQRRDQSMPNEAPATKATFPY